MTEKQIESYLEEETRMLPLPDSSEQLVRGPKLMWDAVDFIIDTHTYTMTELINLTQDNMRKQDCSFQESFERVVAYIQSHMTR